MKFGRIVRVSRLTGPVETFVIAEPDKARAIALLTASVAGEFDKVEPIGRASPALLKEMGLGPGDFGKAVL